MCGRFLIDFENVFNENVYVCIEYVYNNNNIEEKAIPFEIYYYGIHNSQEPLNNKNSRASSRKNPRVNI